MPFAFETLGLLGWLAASFAAAALGGVASIDAGDFYLRATWQLNPNLLASLQAG